MKEKIVTGRSLPEIRREVAEEWACSPDKLEIEVLEKSGLFNRVWKVKVRLNDSGSTVDKTLISREGEKYIIVPNKKVEKIIPFPEAGQLLFMGNEIKQEYELPPESILEFLPASKKASLTWDIEVSEDNLQAIAKVKHERAGRYLLQEAITEAPLINIQKHLIWKESAEEIPLEIRAKEELLEAELEEKGITYGLKPDLWAEFLKVDGEKEIVVAQGLPPTETSQPRIVDYVSESPAMNQDTGGKVDHFGSRIRVCEKDELLAKIVPGQEGEPGLNIFGHPIPVEELNEIKFKPHDSVYLSEDGLELRAAIEGLPVRLDKYTYRVENAYIVKDDVDLATGSIEFPGNVLVFGNVNDGFFVRSGGKIEIQGSVSGAELKAETGLKVHKNIIASRIRIGERHVFRSELYALLQEIIEELTQCLRQVKQLQETTADYSCGQLLKIVLEKNFPLLPSKVEKLENLLSSCNDPDLITEELKIASRTLKRFLIGLGPLQLTDIILLQNTLSTVNGFIMAKENLIPTNVLCDVDYIQNSNLRCAGDLICRKGIYNSRINVQGNVKIQGVCRGGEITCGGDLYVWELGGASVSSTLVYADKDSKLKIDHCYSNVTIYVGKEIVKIEENVQKLDIYRDKGRLQVEKIKWDASSEFV